MRQGSLRVGQEDLELPGETRYIKISIIEHIASLAFLSVKGRVAHALLELAETVGLENGSGEVLIPRMINQKGLAAIAGVARENVNRVLGDFQRSKIVSKSSDAFRIDDRDKLEREVAW